MTDPADAGTQSGRESPRRAAAMPRWVKVFLIIAAALVVLMIALMLVSGGRHGPGRHISACVWNCSVQQHGSLQHSAVSWRH